MKRLGFLFISLFILFCVTLLYYAYFHDDESNYQVIYLNDIKGNEMYLGCIDESGKVVKIYLDKVNDEISLNELFSYYTVKQNSLPNDYYSPLGYEANFEKIELINNKLYLKIDNINNSELVDEFIECIKITLEENNLDNVDEVSIDIGLSNYLIKYNKTQ